MILSRALVAATDNALRIQRGRLLDLASSYALPNPQSTIVENSRPLHSSGVRSLSVSNSVAPMILDRSPFA